MPRCWWSQLNQIKKQLLSGWQPTVDLGKGENQAKRESVTEELRGKKKAVEVVWCCNRAKRGIELMNSILMLN